MQSASENSLEVSRETFVKEVLNDYRIAFESRQASLIGRKEVLTGKAKFGIFGDGKEVAQIAMARVFQLGDWRSGYYRDQTFMFAKGMSTVQQFFAQLYAHPDIDREPASGGRSMNGHFATRYIDTDGNWLNQTETYNCSADISPTGGQMPRLLGLALASKLYRTNPELKEFTQFSKNGNEIAFGTIGNASTSEGIFWETINAACVMQVPLLMSVWDDAYGISVPAKYQTTKENISEILKGFKSDKNGRGLEIFVVQGWNYPELCKTYQQAAEICRNEHTPVLVHVIEMTQPQGHSTSGSHERYKSAERLKWESENDCLLKMRQWMIENEICAVEEIDQIEAAAIEFVKNSKKTAWTEFISEIKTDLDKFCKVAQDLSAKGVCTAEFAEMNSALQNIKEPLRKDIGLALNEAMRITAGFSNDHRSDLLQFYTQFYSENRKKYNSHLYSESEYRVENIPTIAPEFSDEIVDGYQVVRACFEHHLQNNPLFFAFGEDVGKIGDVNQGFSGLQEKFGELRVTDKGIREWSIVGEGLGAAMRGLRPLAEIQYLDYLLYALPVLSDDISTLQYRTAGGQKAPVIIRTRGHRLEGIWHSGSPMGTIINAVRGMHVCVPRDMTRAAGMYNTLLQSDEPALVIECLNGYRSKEKMPKNVGTFTVPLGVPEILRYGTDITLVTYGSCCKLALQAVDMLNEVGISVELIDAQTLLPFDTNGVISNSIKNTNRFVVLDEDVSGGASAFIFQKVLQEQQAYHYLDSSPIAISAKDHRPAYGTDGDYFSKPGVDEIFAEIYQLMHEANPLKWPSLF